jgi:nitroreductase
MISFEQFKELCDARRSIRYFDDRPVERKQLEMLLEVGAKAPNVQNTQPWRFHVILNKEMKNTIMKASCYGNFVAGASAFIVVTSDTSARKETSETMWNPRELEYSCVSAMGQMILAATAMGLGTCWISLHHGDMHDLLKLPKNELVVGGLMIGKLKHGEEAPSGPHKRKPMNEIVQWYE